MHSLRRRFIIFFGLFILASCSVMGVFAALSIVNTGVALSTEQGYPVAEKAAAVIDGDAFERFVANPSESDPFYERTRLALFDIKQTVNCEYLYTMVQVNGTLCRYVIDGSCDPSDTENFSPLGTEEDISGYGAAPLRVFRLGGIESSGLEKQEGWGYVISTYKAILNSHGQIVGMIGVDFNVDTIMAMLRRRIVSIAVVSLLFFVAGIALVFIFTSKIFGTMRTISSAMEEISSGKADLTHRIPQKGQDELADLAGHCNGVIESLNDLVLRLQGETTVLNETGQTLSSKMQAHLSVLTGATDNVSDIAASISEQTSQVEKITGGMQSVESEIQNLDKRITEQFAAIQQSSSAVEQISANIKSVDKNVATIMQEYRALVKESDDGKKQQASVSTQIESIAQQSSKLTTANAAISSIAEQTNLLAMNAAIEAAHAGEAGKGFAVVAGEIRSLAETSSKQSDSISSLLQAITESINGIVESSAKSSRMFTSVGEKISQLEMLIREVQNGMNEEQTGAENILRTMLTLEGTTNDIKSASHQMKDESEHVFEGIQALKDLAEVTHQKSVAVNANMGDMKASAGEVLSAADLSRIATDKVSAMINGFTTASAK